MQANYYIHSKQIGLHKREAYYEQRKDEEFSHVSSELKNPKSECSILCVFAHTSLWVTQLTRPCLAVGWTFKIMYYFFS